MTSQPQARINWLVLCAVFAAALVVLVTRYFLHADTVPLILDTDDAMRLTVVRDFLAGQNWFDNVQHRMNTPFGAEIHWSRLVDLPIAILTLLARPLAGANAEMVAAFLWPLLLLFVLLALSAALCVRLIGKEGTLPGAVLPVFSPSILNEFVPGRVDHHNVQLILALAVVHCAVEALRRPLFALGAGLACASALAIGTEAVPTVAAAVGAFALAWVRDPGRARPMRLFGLAFAVSSLVHLAIALPPSRWLSPACDALSIVYVAAAIGIGAAFVLLAALPLSQRPWWQRLLASGGLGFILLAALAIAFPDCRKGPYGQVDPWLVAHWIDNISEARPIWQSIFELPDFTIAAVIPVVAGLAVTAWHVLKVRDERTGQWAVLGLFLFLSFVVMCLQIRGARTAVLFSVPAGAWLIVTARAHYMAHSKAREAVVLVGSWLLFAGVAFGTAVTYIGALLPGAGASMDNANRGDRVPCLMPQAFADLAALPPERLMTPIDLGSHMLLYTPHAVVAAPYHRNQQGVLDAFDFFNQPIDEARSILEARGVSLVVTCPAMSEMAGLSDAAPDSFVHLAQSGALPDWIADVSPPGAVLRTYAVRPR